MRITCFINVFYELTAQLIATTVHKCTQTGLDIWFTQSSMHCTPVYTAIFSWPCQLLTYSSSLAFECIQDKAEAQETNITQSRQFPK